MKKIVFVFSVILALPQAYGYAQFDSLMNYADSIEVVPRSDIFSIGFGMGQDYGGFGLNALVYPQHNIGIFGGVGYPLYNVGYNVGLKFRFSSKKKFHSVVPYATFMYGYNALIKVKDSKELNKLFYGPSIGAGVDFIPWSGSFGYWSFAILVPFRSSGVDDYISDLEHEGVVFKNKLSPVLISIGYRIITERKNK